ncbi:MAG TPA: alpha-L-fucosidase [Gemmatimonadaceae bacterium]|nr:alpha-L-fucosidase [Gemmatimonadaceae bacterium]
MDRRSFVLSGAAALAGCWLPHRGAWAPAPALGRPHPSPSQLAWQRDELAMFCHFGVNTFTDREWGDGHEDPAIFNPAHCDPRQWARAARAAGFRAMILTAKHHDGFCLWPTATTRHSVASSPWRDGHGDVVREFVDACRAEGLRPGLYLSPWDRNNPAYGDSPRYNDLYCDQLTELLTHYGTIAEVWFDGANGEGPNGRKQTYDWPRFWGLVRRLQPGAVMFSDAGPDIRWCGNERGVAGDPNWSTVDPGAVPYPGASGPGVTPALQHGDPAGPVWRPAEADVSIRPGWFYHAAEDRRVRSVESLIELYFSSVGRNSKLLLNVPPTREGLLHDVDVARLREFRDRRDTLFGHDLASGARASWRATGPRSAELEVALDGAARVGIARLEERIEGGQAVAGYTLYGADGGDWRVLSRGTTIGYAKLDRLEPVMVSRVRLTIDDAVAPPQPLTIRLYSV